MQEDVSGSFTLAVTDPEGQPVNVQAVTKPAWLTLTVNSAGIITMSGTPPPGSVGPYPVTLVATDSVQQSTTISFDVYIDEYAASPLKGKLIFTEVLYAETGGAQVDEFAEITNIGDAPINLENFKMAEFNYLAGSCEGPCSPYGFPANDDTGANNTSVLQPGESAVLWIWRPAMWGGTLNTEAALDYYANSGGSAYSILDDTGDELWLLDANDKVIDFVAWGSEADDGFVTDPVASVHGLWDTTNDWRLLGAQPGQSIALATTGDGKFNPDCWEQTTSGAAFCADATSNTVDRDATSQSSSGQPNVD